MQQAEKAVILAIGTIVATMALTVLLSPVVYDTGHFADTHFMLGAAWRQYLGLTPTVDFGYFYGGFTSWVVAKAFRLFGPDVHGFDQALLMLLGGFGLAITAIAFRRISSVGAATAFLVIATLMLTRHPLEDAESLTRLFSTHSFLYNRIGLGIVIIVGLFAALSSPSRAAEIAGGAVSGGLLVVVMLTKPTFIVLVPAVLLALAIQARWAALTTAGVVFLCLLMITDPWGARWLASFQYSQASVGDRPDAGVVPLIRKAVQIPLAQPVALTLVIAMFAGLFLTPPRPWGPLLALGLVAGGGLGMAATMGGGGALGQLALPILAMATLVGAELARRQQLSLTPATTIGALVLAAGFSLPHAANLMGTTLEGWSKRHEILIMDGPLSDYLSTVEDAGPETVTQYRMLADGIAALRRFGDLSDVGVIADNGITFDFALLSKPVAGYPLWQRAIAPELAPDRPLPSETDIVLLGRGAQRDVSLGPLLREKMSGNFTLCTETAYWSIFVRNEMTQEQC